MESEDEEYYYYSDEENYSMDEDGDDSRGKGAASTPGRPSDDGKLEGKEPSSARSARSAHSGGAPGGLSGGVDGSVGASGNKTGPSLEYQVLTEEQLQSEQAKIVTNIAEVLDISYDTANVLLLHNLWNRERLLDAYYADPDKACLEAGAQSQAQSQAAEAVAKAEAAAAESAASTASAAEGSRMETDDDEGKSQSKGAESKGEEKSEPLADDFLCTILYIDVPRKYTYSMGCKDQDGTEHRYSLDAWHGHLRSVVGEGKACVFARCPGEACKLVVSPGTWERVLTHPLQEPGQPADEAAEKGAAAALAKYKSALTQSFVDINRNMKWCPGQGCDRAVQASGAVKEVTCSGCGTGFCFKCGQDAHAPVSCDSLALWLEKCQNESETCNWIIANTKACPKCRTSIEKNGGCNHVNCRVCKHDFCWICSGNWAEHGSTSGGYYNCNKFESDKAAAGDDQSKAKHELDRYLHYYKRYAAHQQAGKFATDQREKAEQRMVEMQASKAVGWIDVQFLESAVEQLIECRRVLMYTYAYAYYLTDGPAKELFEYNQALLESNTEKLSELSEAALDTVDRSEVINYTRVTGNFLKSLLEQVELGDVPMTVADAEMSMSGAAATATGASSSSASAAGATRTTRAAAAAASKSKRPRGKT